MTTDTASLPPALKLPPGAPPWARVGVGARNLYRRIVEAEGGDPGREVSLNKVRAPAKTREAVRYANELAVALLIEWTSRRPLRLRRLKPYQ